MMVELEPLKILLVEDSDADAALFNFQILKNPKLDRYLVEVQHCYSLAEALSWLAASPQPPSLICLDLSVPGLDRANLKTAINKLSRYVADKQAIVGLTGSDPASLIWQALEYEIGSDNVFSKNSITRDQDPLLEAIQRIASRTSSGSSRTMQIDIARQDEKLKAIADGLAAQDQHLTKLVQTVFMGDGSGSGSLVYVVFQLEKAIDTLKAELKELKQSQSEATTQFKLKRLDFWLKIGGYGVLAVLAAAFVRWLGSEAAIEILKALVG